MTNYSHKVIPLYDSTTGKGYAVVVSKKEKSSQRYTHIIRLLNAYNSKECVVGGVMYVFNQMYGEKDHHHFSVYHDHFYHLLRSIPQGSVPGIFRGLSSQNFSINARKLPFVGTKNSNKFDEYASSVHIIRSVMHQSLEDVLESAIEVDYRDVLSFGEEPSLDPVDDCYGGIDFDTTTVVHTDASFNEVDCTGAVSIFNSACTNLSTTLAFKDTQNLNSNTLELLGIYHAAMLCKEEEKVVIFSDSLSMTNLVQDKSISTETQESTWYDDSVDAMVSQLHALDNVEVRWVRGHNNDYHNMVVDCMCKSVRRHVDRSFYDEDHFPVSFALSPYGKKCYDYISSLSAVVNSTGVEANPVELISSIHLYDSVVDYLAFSKRGSNN